MKRDALIAAATALVAIGALVAAELTPVEQPRAPQVQNVVLPGEAGCSITAPVKGRLWAPDASTATALDDAPVADPTGAQALTAPVRVTVPDATLSESAMVEGASSDGRVWAECATPSTSTFLQLPDVGSGDIVLTNTDSSDAVVNITLYGANGEIVESGARGLPVARHSSRVVPMSVLAPAGMPIGASVRTSQGRVLAVARLQKSGGGTDQAAGQQLAQTQVVAGVPAKTSRVSLLLTNPGEQTVTATLTVLGARGAFAPAGHETVELAPRSSAVVDLTTAVNGEAVAIRAVADRGQLAATVQALGAGDAALIPASAAGDHLVSHGPAGVLQVVNPSSEQVSVTVGSEKVTIPAGAAWQGASAAGRVEVKGASVVAAVMSTQGVAVHRVPQVQLAGAAGPVQPDPALR